MFFASIFPILLLAVSIAQTMKTKNYLCNSTRVETHEYNKTFMRAFHICEILKTNHSHINRNKIYLVEKKNLKEESVCEAISYFQSIIFAKVQM